MDNGFARLLCAVGLLAASAGLAQPMQVVHDKTVASMVSDEFTWIDSSGQQRVAVLAHNDTPAGPNGARGGALREFRYQLAPGTTRIVSVTDYAGGAAQAGFGYVVMHASRSGCIPGSDDSPLGGFQPGAGWERIFEGRHHAIFRFRQNYPRNCSTTNPVVARTIPVTIDWIFATGRDHPVYAITIDPEHASDPTPGMFAPVNTFYDDSRAPYGEMNIDGVGAANIDGVAWGDRFKFTSTSTPVTLDSSWTWNVPNTVPWVKEWMVANDATMGIVQTQTMTQQDAAGGRDAVASPNGIDVSVYWNKTSLNGDACPNANPALSHSMPCPDDFAYQSIGNSLKTAAQGGTNNAHMTWKTQYGFVGQATYAANDGSGVTPPGFPRKSYSTYIVFGKHSTGPVETQVTQVETVQSLTLTTLIGSVVTVGPAGVNRPAAETVNYAPAGYNHVYGALAFAANANQLDANINVGAGTLTKPLIIISNYTADYPQVKFGGASLTADVDYFASLRPAANELWITFNRNLTGAANRIEIIPPGPPAAPVGFTATAASNTRVDLLWNAVAGAQSYQVDRKSPGTGFVQIATPNNNSYSDLAANADTAYLYRVRAVNGAMVSANSAPDIATTTTFTNNPLAAGIVVQAAHLAELRTAINAVRQLANLGVVGFTDAAVAGTTIRAIHVTEMRAALDAALAQLTLPTPAYTDGALAGIVVKAIHFQELRDRTQ